MSKISVKDFRSFPMTGEAEFDLSIILQKFDKKTAIYQWKDTYRLIQDKGIKTSITKIQALQVIDLLKLYPVACPPFKNATTWRLENIQK